MKFTLNIFFVAILLFLTSKSYAQDATKAICYRWELTSLSMGARTIETAELRQKKNNMNMEFGEEGACTVIPSIQEAPIKKNKWRWEEEGKSIVIITLDEKNKRINQTFKVEKLTPKTLILSIGDNKNREVFTYKNVGKVRK